MQPLNAVMKKRLAEFVDRDREIARFCQILDGSNEPPIMAVWGESGMGKTSLLARMMHECSLRELRKAEVIWKDSNPPDHMAIMRKIRDDVGANHFVSFTDLVNYYYQEGYQPHVEVNLNLSGIAGISVGESMRVSDASVGDIAGVVVKDCMIVIPRQDMAIPETERRARLTHRFIEDLKHALADGPLVVFFDAIEKISKDTESWLWEQFLDFVRSEQIPNIKFVMCGHRRPPSDRDWRDFIEEMALNPLENTDVVLYLEKRFPELSAAEHSSLALLISSMSTGNPAKVANMADAFAKMRERQAA